MLIYFDCLWVQPGVRMIKRHFFKLKDIGVYPTEFLGGYNHMIKSMTLEKQERDVLYIGPSYTILFYIQ